MRVRAVINGFARAGRYLMRTAYGQHGDIEGVAVNDLNIAAPALAHLLWYDFGFGRFPAQVVAEEGGISIGGDRLLALGEADPNARPWSELGVDVVPWLLTSPTRSTAACDGTASLLPMSGSGRESL